MKTRSSEVQNNVIGGVDNDNDNDATDDDGNDNGIDTGDNGEESIRELENGRPNLIMHATREPKSR